MSKKSQHTSFIQEYRLSVLAGIIALSLVCGYIMGMSIQKSRYVHFLSSFKNIRENSDKYKFINPLIGTVSPPATDVDIFSDIKSDIVSYLVKEKKEGSLYDYSFYFRDLGTGLWFGAHEDADFSPASLFKLPVAIAVYKQAESDSAFLKKLVVYTKELDDMNNSATSNAESVLVIGKAYTIEELVLLMIVDSDNGAKNLLLASIDISYLDNLFTAVSLASPSQSTVYSISSRKYAHFLRALYGSSYLNEEHSEFILSILSQTTFKDGLVAGLPKGMSVAHKYGTYQFEEMINGEKMSTEQLHDCGVVYHKENPYIFCFMTKGKDLKNLYRIISHVSSLVYKSQEK